MSKLIYLVEGAVQLLHTSPTVEIKNYPAVSAGAGFTRAGGKSLSGRELENSVVRPSSSENLAREERPIEISAIQSTINRLNKDSASAGFAANRDNMGAKTRQALNAYHSQIDMDDSEQKTEFSRLFGIDFYV